MRKLFGLGAAKVAQRLRGNTVDRNSFNLPASLQKPAREGRNIPRPWPVVKAWSPDIPIATIPSVVQTGVGASGPTRGILGQAGLQLPPRGAGLILGTARAGLARGLGSRLTELERLTRHTALRGQAQPPLADQPYGGASISIDEDDQVATRYFKHKQTLTYGQDPEIVAIDEAAVSQARARALRRPEIERFYEQGVFGIRGTIRRVLSGEEP